MRCIMHLFNALDPTDISNWLVRADLSARAPFALCEWQDLFCSRDEARFGRAAREFAACERNGRGMQIYQFSALVHSNALHHCSVIAAELARWLSLCTIRRRCVLTFIFSKRVKWMNLKLGQWIAFRYILKIRV